MSKKRRNVTAENIKRKRIVKRRRRRLKVFRLLVFLIVVGLMGTALCWIGYHTYTFGSRVYSDISARYQDYSQRRDERIGNIDSRFDGYTNILFTGVDDGDVTGEGKRADAIMLISLNNETGDINCINIPRDSLVNIPGYENPERINNAYTHGGASLTMKAVTNLTGIAIHQYITLDTRTLADIIDTLGGIDIYVGADMDYEDPEAGLAIHIKKGLQHMDGDTAQQYLRYRSGEFGDVGRARRQQKFVRAFYEMLLQPENITKAPEILEILQTRIDTSVEIFDLAQITNLLRKIQGQNLNFYSLPGIPDNNDPSIWNPDANAIGEMLDLLFPIPGQDAAE